MNWCVQQEGETLDAVVLLHYNTASKGRMGVLALDIQEVIQSNTTTKPKSQLMFFNVFNLEFY